MGNKATDSYREEEIERNAIGLATDALLEALRFHHDHNIRRPKGWMPPAQVAPPPTRPARFNMDNISDGPKIRDIQTAVAEYFKLEDVELLSNRRCVKVVRPRQIGYYLCKKLTRRSLPEIGRKFGRDHTSIIAGVRKIEELIIADEQIAVDVRVLTSRLGGYLG